MTSYIRMPVEVEAATIGRVEEHPMDPNLVSLFFAAGHAPVTLNRGEWREAERQLGRVPSPGDMFVAHLDGSFEILSPETFAAEFFEGRVVRGSGIEDLDATEPTLH